MAQSKAERELEECRAVLQDLHEEKNLRPLWLLHFVNDDTDESDDAVVLRAVTLTEAKELVEEFLINWTEGMYGDDISTDYTCQLARLIDRPLGVLSAVGDGKSFWKGVISIRPEGE